MTEQSKWIKLTQQNPDHSLWYIQRFEDMEAEGKDLDGEARLIDAMVDRGSRILDAGCGPGRVAAALSAVGHDVVGVDVDPVLIEAARQKHDLPQWCVADLAELDLPAMGVTDGFDAIVAAGNVMTFVAPSTRRDVLARLRAHLGPSGRIVAGFGGGRDYEFDEFFTDVEAVGLTTQVKLASWDLRPFTPNSDFLVAVLGET